MGYYHLTGMVLKSDDVRETDVVVTAFSRERGKVRFLVRGTKKPASSLRNAAEPITEGRFFLAERRNMDLLSEWEPVDFFMAVKRDPAKLSYASYFLRYLVEMTVENHAEKELFNLFKNTIYLLSVDIYYDIIKVIFEWGFLRVSGQAPLFGVCSECGKSFDSCVWDIGEGDFLCGSCAGAGRLNCVKLRPGSVSLGRRIVGCSEYAGRYELGGLDEAAEFAKKLPFDPAGGRKHLAPLLDAVARFCRYHLREDIPEWLIRLDR